jgi:tetratricopeptide (TPR) repeat protein
VEASSEDALERHLVEQLARRAAAAVVASPESVPALLAVDGELKAGNRLAEAGEFERALAEWTRRPLKGDKEAARLHNVGVAYEALAYRLPPQDPEHQAHLEKAAEHYRKALALDPGEKYFAEPVERIGTSLQYAEAARKIVAALEQSRTSHRRERGGRPEPKSTARVAAPPAAPAPPAPSSAGAPLRNGSFESSLAPWTVLELSAAAGPSDVAQDLDVAVGGRTVLTLDYKVMAGEPPVRVLLGYEDAQGRPRSSKLEVSAGESPGGWDTWQADLATLRPRPARLTELRVQVEGGTVRLDNVAVGAR